MTFSNTLTEYLIMFLLVLLDSIVFLLEKQNIVIIHNNANKIFMINFFIFITCLIFAQTIYHNYIFSSNNFKKNQVIFYLINFYSTPSLLILYFFNLIFDLYESIMFIKNLSFKIKSTEVYVTIPTSVNIIVANIDGLRTIETILQIKYIIIPAKK